MKMIRTRKQIDALLTKVAKKHLGIETLVPQNRDRLDFHNVGVRSLKDALEAAFLIGVEAGFLHANRLNKKTGVKS